ncbi:FMN-binding negative transcriptional regulator [Streptomyces chartreusis]|uniref:FMN-binding negative transcriptional regulator n=1 Tax=Streptomyces chartreusis TaxID=1969 RepID=UPI003642B645
MPIHAWDAPHDDTEWQRWLDDHEFGQLVVNGLDGAPPHVQPLHFAFDAESGEVVTHLARPDPMWPALLANPEVVLSAVEDHVYVPGPWQAGPEQPAEHGEPTGLYAAVQLRCRARVVDDPAAKPELLNRQVGHFQPEGGSAEAGVGLAPYGPLLAGIRGLRLEVTGVRAKFKFGGRRTAEVQDRIAGNPAGRGGPRDAAAREHMLRRRPA